jgi:peptidoglycan/xylan/chitin deacetylase (PgdA/CDA1 family)
MKKPKAILLVLNYHHVSEIDSPKSLYDVSLSDLRDQLQIIADEGLSVSSLDDEPSFETTDPFRIGISFDDGNASDYDLVLPALKQHNFKASFFPISNYVNKPGRLSAAQLCEIAGQGHCIGSHGMTHEILTKADPGVQMRELQESKRYFEEVLGKPVKSFAFPYGHFNDDLVARAKTAGYKHLFTTGMRINILNESAEIIYRWNVTCKTSLEQFRKVISSKGLVSPASELQNKLQQIIVKSSS